MIKRQLIFFCILIESISRVSSQDILSTIDKYAINYGQEKIYLHFDKSTYSPAETIWYKVYMMKGIEPGNESRNVYVDWSDEKGTLLLHSVIPVQGASSSGQFDIPDKYAGRYIHVKVYTKWMLNFDSAFLYNKDIPVISKQSQQVFSNNTPVPEISFFPEGGDLVSGVINKVAFKANDQWGRPINISGVIQNNKGTIIDSLHFIHDGMGFIFLRPAKGETFSAKWSLKSPIKKETITDLPVPKDTGLSLQVLIDGTKRICQLNAASASATLFGNIHVIGTMNQFKVFNFTKDISSGVVNFIIPTNNLPSGILTITVFDNNWMPIAERITYVNNEEFRATVDMTVEHWGLSKRARNEIQIIAPDGIQSNLSVAVTDLAIDTDSSDNIISHLLLTGDLKGMVYNPSYYFTENSDSMSRQLDLVMLTHGWRRFKWPDVAAGKSPTILYPKDTSFLTLSGKLYGLMSSQLRDAGIIFLVIQDKNKNATMVSMPINPDGTFNDPSSVFFDTVTVYYQLQKNKEASSATVKFMEERLSPFSYNIPASGLYNNQIPDTTGHAYHIKTADDERQDKEFFNAKVLETVVVKAKTKPPLEIMDEKYTSGLFSGGDAIQFDLLNDPLTSSSGNIFNYLQGKVAGLQITGANPPSLSWRGSTPLLYLNETQVDKDIVSSISPNDVAYIKVMRPPFFGGFGGGAGGAIAIYTRKGDEQRNTDSKGLNKNRIWGYNFMREFYSPVYSSFAPPDDKKDLRTTLYWNPNVITLPGKNKITLKFYNNDITKAFRVVIEGMTEDGRLVHYLTTME